MGFSRYSEQNFFFQGNLPTPWIGNLVSYCRHFLLSIRLSFKTYLPLAHSVLIFSVCHDCNVWCVIGSRLTRGICQYACDSDYHIYTHMLYIHITQTTTTLLMYYTYHILYIHTLHVDTHTPHTTYKTHSLPTHTCYIHITHKTYSPILTCYAIIYTHSNTHYHT